MDFNNLIKNLINFLERFSCPTKSCINCFLDYLFTKDLLGCLQEAVLEGLQEALVSYFLYHINKSFLLAKRRPSKSGIVDKNHAFWRRSGFKEGLPEALLGRTVSCCDRSP